MASSYDIRITEEIIRRGYRRKEDCKWECIGVASPGAYQAAIAAGFDTAHALAAMGGIPDGCALTGACELCGHSPIEYHFFVRNRVDGAVMTVGSECVNNIHGIDPGSAAVALALFKKEYATKQKERREQLQRERKETYQKEYAKEIDYLVKRMEMERIPQDLWDIKTKLEQGKKVSAADIEYVRQAMGERPLKTIIKERNKAADSVIGANPKEFKAFVMAQADKQPTNDFWQSMKARTESGTLSPKMVEAVRRAMDREKPVEDRKPLMENVEIEIPAWLARDRSISKFLKGDVLYESAKAYYFKGTSVVRPSSTCLRCGRALTHPISLVVGYGPECCEKLAISWIADPERIEELKKAIENRSFEGWLPKSKVTIQ